MEGSLRSEGIRVLRCVAYCRNALGQNDDPLNINSNLLKWGAWICNEDRI